ncbi:hypothetical protein [Deinococcus sp. QL22]|uniref:hypothetical protein n=1 Tax=Deinococcus sp. QL22 TaxID=2939437 RepID=UPI002017B508|nr:hypothetical protein [Deinococcus sp. QL22]UQN08299.1 hypothetical protein M1R55_16325 [Deinococcus sp. QL22]
MKTLDSLLKEAGYSSMRTQVVDGTTKVARWYHPEHHTTIVAFAGWQASDNTFTAGEFPGLMRWNELIATP